MLEPGEAIADGWGQSATRGEVMGVCERVTVRRDGGERGRCVRFLGGMGRRSDEGRERNHGIWESSQCRWEYYHQWAYAAQLAGELKNLMQKNYYQHSC